MSKGEVAERTLAEDAWERGFASLRAPGSGSIDRPSPDVVIFGDPIAVIELKADSDGTATFEEEEIVDLETWAVRCDADAYVGVKPDLRSHNSWYFLETWDLNRTKSGNYSIRKEDHSDCLSMDDLFEMHQPSEKPNE